MLSLSTPASARDLCQLAINFASIWGRLASQAGRRRRTNGNRRSTNGNIEGGSSESLVVERALPCGSLVPRRLVRAKKWRGRRVP
jgi:hypothetical protein